MSGAVETALRQIESLPLHRYLGMGRIETEPDAAWFVLEVGDHSANPGGSLHGGVIATLCDVACYAALQSSLRAGEDAVTHDLHVSVMRAARRGDRVRFHARLIKRGRSLAFLEASAACGDLLLATAHVTKSIVAAR